MRESLVLHAEILWPALLAGLLVLSTHVPLGREVLRRGIIFMDLAIAQVAALGLIMASALGLGGHDDQGALWQNLIAMGAAIVGAMLLYSFRRLEARIQEALIGSLFMLAATGSLLLLAADPHGGERLKELLVGQILWVQPMDLLGTGVVYALVLGLWCGLRQRLGDWLFYPLFAVTITLSTQLVGVYLVFSSLIIPALATLRSERPLLPAYLIGFVAYLTGLVVSALCDLPSGAMIAWCLAATAVLYYAVIGRFFAASYKSS
ncbi:MAG: metal ABC transporter permease [Pseudomonadales bacterium]|jgi:zinc/manganese transport system permease protein